MSNNLKLYSNWNLGMLLTLMVAPILGHAGEIQGHSASRGQNSELTEDFIAGKRGSHSKGREDRKDGRDGRDCGFEFQDNNTQIAYFYVTPSSLKTPFYIRNEPGVILKGESIQWDSELFTIKSKGINIKGGCSIDLKDAQPFNFFTTNDDIVISKGGFYRITYSVFANAYHNKLVDSYTMELQINDSPVPGSRYTATLGVENATIETISLENAAPINTIVLERDAAQLTGQVVTYIPAGSNLELVNVGLSDIRLENKPGLKGVVASILIEKIADPVN